MNEDEDDETPSMRSTRKQTDARAMEFAVDNAQQVPLERRGQGQANQPSVDGTAEKELASLLSLDKSPYRIECYDISHTQGKVAVGSRVVGIDGKPARSLYQKFIIKTVDGVDDYASLEEAWLTQLGFNTLHLRVSDEFAFAVKMHGHPNMALGAKKNGNVHVLECLARAIQLRG